MAKMRSSRPEVFCKRGVQLEILQNSQKNTCAKVSFLIRLGLRPATVLKKRLWRRGFPVNFLKFLRTLFRRTPLVAASESSKYGRVLNMLALHSILDMPKYALTEFKYILESRDAKILNITGF